jgi:hypothetical protein
MTREYYIDTRQKGMFNEQFVYKAYQDTHKNDIGHSQFFTVLQLTLFNKQKSYEQLVSHLVKYYDEKFNITLLTSGEKIIKVY